MHLGFVIGDVVYLVVVIILAVMIGWGSSGHRQVIIKDMHGKEIHIHHYWIGIIITASSTKAPMCADLYGEYWWIFFLLHIGCGLFLWFSDFKDFLRLFKKKKEIKKKNRYWKLLESIAREKK